MLIVDSPLFFTLSVEPWFLFVSIPYLSGGTESEGEIRHGDWLEIMEFSDFSVDFVTGDIAGEIRLGYLHRNGQTVSVSGGSISGNMNELVKNMQFSAESRQYDCAMIPAVTRLNGATVTGAV